ncbi:MAG TPA: hypothetical protein VKC89_03145 [Patescibacteria group bacterium]|nr:hypothetical protein [Patescibacteria group bacterium]
MKDLALSIGQPASPTFQIEPPQGIGFYSVSSLLSFGVTILLVISIILTLFFLVLGGIDMITSGGDKQKVVNARHKLTYAVLGLLVVFLSFLIVNLIGSVFGVDLLNVNNRVPWSGH